MIPDPWCTATRHGDRTAYCAGCRCTTARRSCAAYQRRLYWDLKAGKRRLIDSTGSRRRLEALHAAGWTGVYLATRLGVIEPAVQQYRKRAKISLRVAAKIRLLYRELRYIPGPSSVSAKRAALAGWRPPSWWGDDIDDPNAVPVSPWQTYLDHRPIPLLTDRDGLDDARDRAVDEALDAIDAADEAWFAEQRREVAA